MNSRVIAREVNNDIELLLRETYIEGRREYELIINGIFIMASYNHLSSELLVRNAIKFLEKSAGLKILIGGLGMGFSVNEARRLQGLKRIDVIEKQPTVIEWNRSFLKGCNNSCLEDRRVSVINSDFYDYMMDTSCEYDLIIMDIDNGPMMLLEEDNIRVYQPAFLERIKNCMCPGGVLSVWSCRPDPKLYSRLAYVFKHCIVEEAAEEHSGETVPYYLYFAR